MATSSPPPEVVEGDAEGEVTLDARTPSHEVRFQLGPSADVPTPRRMRVTVSAAAAQLVGPPAPLEVPIELRVAQVGGADEHARAWAGTTSLSFDADTRACPSEPPDDMAPPCGLAFLLRLSSPGITRQIAVAWRANAVAYAASAASRAESAVGVHRGSLPTNPSPPIAPQHHAQLVISLLLSATIGGWLAAVRTRRARPQVSSTAPLDPAVYATQLSLAALLSALAVRIATVPDGRHSVASEPIVAAAVALLGAATLYGLVARRSGSLPMAVANTIALLFVVPWLAWIVVDAAPSVAPSGAVLVALLAGFSAFGLVAGVLDDRERRSSLSAGVVVVHIAIAVGCLLAATGVLTATTTGDPGTVWSISSVFLLPGAAVAFGVYDWLRGGRAPLVLADLTVCIAAVPLFWFLASGLGDDPDPRDNIVAIAFLGLALTGLFMAARAITVAAVGPVRPITSGASPVRIAFRAHGLRRPSRRTPPNAD